MRGEPKHFTASKLFCWVACDRGARLARVREDWSFAERCKQEAEAIREDMCLHGLDDRGVFTQHYETAALDAALLGMPLLGFLPPRRRTGPADRARDRRRAHR